MKKQNKKVTLDAYVRGNPRRRAAYERELGAARSLVEAQGRGAMSRVSEDLGIPVSRVSDVLAGKVTSTVTVWRIVDHLAPDQEAGEPSDTPWTDHLRKALDMTRDLEDDMQRVLEEGP